MNDTQFNRHVLKLLAAWLALLALMFASLGSAYFPLGIGNAIAGIAVAVVKSAIVLVLFMGLARSGTMVRIVAATALGTWVLLLALSGVDYSTRPSEPAAYQQPEQLSPFGGKEDAP